MIPRKITFAVKWFFVYFRRLIVATGISTPVIPDVKGIEYADGYETMSLDTDDYEGQSVLILGKLCLSGLQKLYQETT